MAQFSPEGEPKSTSNKVNINLEDLIKRTLDLLAAKSDGLDSVEANEYTRELQNVYDQYQNLELTLPIKEQPLRRICQALTNEGFTTVECTEGQNNGFPKVYFTCMNQAKLRELVHVVARVSLPKKFLWQIKLFSSDPFHNPNSPLLFVLEPVQPDDLNDPRVIDAKKNNKELLEDIDIVGIRLVEHFKSISE